MVADCSLGLCPSAGFGVLQIYRNELVVLTSIAAYSSSEGNHQTGLSRYGVLAEALGYDQFDAAG